jgi:hypothetical protein
MYDIASKETVDYKKGTFFGPVGFTRSPIFTAQETVVIETRIRRTDNKVEAQKLQGLLDAQDTTVIGSLSNILSHFSFGKENIENREAKVFEARKLRDATPTQEIDQDRLPGAGDGGRKSNPNLQPPAQVPLAPRRDDDHSKTIR